MTRLLYLLAHMAVGWISLRLSFLIRFDFLPVPEHYEWMVRDSLPWAFLIKGLVAEGFGLTRRMWRFAAFTEIRAVFFASLLGTLLLVLLCNSLISQSYPRGPFLLDFLLTFTAFAGLRFSGRIWQSLLRRARGARDRRPLRRVLVVGAGPTGEKALRLLGSAALRRTRVVGLLAQDPSQKGSLLFGVPVLGTLEDLPTLLREKAVEEILVALEDPQAEVLRSLFLAASGAGRSLRILSPTQETASGDLYENPIRRLKLSDLLGRPPVRLDAEALKREMAGRRVLVTGAGGSIGSELCRQISAVAVEKLIVLDMAENALFEIAEELESRADCPPLAVVLCDIRCPADLERVFAEHRPELVFHAAACKHVGMMEAMPLEAAKTNVLGTENVLRAAEKAGTRRLLHVSTDKAVNPVGVMGQSKAWSEDLVLRAAGRRSGLCCSCVRFGNVLGSNGSVIPLFERQLKRDGVLRVTHEEATRYFMTLEEAVLLMLHAESLQQSGAVFVLDMGQPVRILDMAEQIRDLTEQETGSRPELKLIGLRPGEKLHESLVTDEQALEPTEIPKVNRILGLTLPDSSLAERQLHSLVDAVQRADVLTVKQLLREGPGSSQTPNRV